MWEEKVSKWQEEIQHYEPKGEGHKVEGVDCIPLTDADAAFILGKGGKTKDKIARVSGARIDLPQRGLALEIRGKYLLYIYL